MKPATLTLYIDGACPLCVAEVHRLRAWDRNRRLSFIDISQPGFDPAPLGANLAAMNRQIHAWTTDGEWLVGIDSMVAAYTLVGKGWLVAPLRIVALRPVYQALYRAFASNRQHISRWLGVKNPLVCIDGTCGIKKTDLS